MSIYRILGTAVLAAVLGGGIAGCGDDGPVIAGESPRVAAREAGAACVEFRGLRHCGLGNARLVEHEGGRLEVTQQRDPDKDGVSIHLPDVTNFEAHGRIDGSAPGSVLNVRALAEDNTIGTMSLRRAGDGYVVSAMFTGANSNGTYDVHLYNGEERLGTISGLASGGSGVYLPRLRMYWWDWWWWWWWPSFWNVRSGPNAGACVWSQQLADGDEVVARVDDGRVVVANRIELEEVVRGGGSYPYMTFNRIDYTTGGRMMLEGVTTENRPEERP